MVASKKAFGKETSRPQYRQMHTYMPV